MGGPPGLAMLVLLAACATERLHDQMDVDGRQIRAGMSADEVTKLLGPPDFRSGSGGHRFAWRFKDAAKEIDPAWEEWAFYPEDYIYVVVYLSGGTVRKVGVAWDSPIIKSDFCSLSEANYSIVTGISVVNDSYADESGSRTRRSAGPGFASLGTLTEPW